MKTMDQVYTAWWKYLAVQKKKANECFKDKLVGAVPFKFSNNRNSHCVWPMVEVSVYMMVAYKVY